MNRSSSAAALAAALLFGPIAAGHADDGRAENGRAEEQRLLGDGHEAARFAALLPFARQIGAGGVVSGSLEESTARAGVPAAVMLEALQALATSLDLGRDVRDGDRFHVRYEQSFTAADAPIGVGRLLWLELRTAAKGTVAIHRFRTRDGSDRFWLANGQAATPPSLRLPVEIVSISSGFGLRADPFARPPPPPTAGTSGAMGGPLRAPPALPPGLPTGGALDLPRAPGAPPLGGSQGLSSQGLSSYGRPSSGPSAGVSPYGNWQQAPRAARPLFMHEGIDLVAPPGTPVLAAADGVVSGAGPNGRYGNWIRIEHPGRLATVYGHLAGFAPGIAAGSAVARGELIGFVGSTGRSTAPHLHFELLIDGKPVNPVNHPELRRGQLRGPDLERFRRQVVQSLAERDREAAARASTPH